MGVEEKIKQYIKKWESKGYEKGIPDEAPFELENRGLAPSYKLICSALLKNPNNLESLGIMREKSKMYNDIKREEIYRRDILNKQLDMFM
tara:strand:+ start:474 stop:743 length:270 start_codon:yes stop_codon:yes gene_type:complete